MTLRERFTASAVSQLAEWRAGWGNDDPHREFLCRFLIATELDFALTREAGDWLAAWSLTGSGIANPAAAGGELGAYAPIYRLMTFTLVRSLLSRDGTQFGVEHVRQISQTTVWLHAVELRPLSALFQQPQRSA